MEMKFKYLIKQRNRYLFRATQLSAGKKFELFFLSVWIIQRSMTASAIGKFVKSSGQWEIRMTKGQRYSRRGNVWW